MPGWVQKVGARHTPKGRQIFFREPEEPHGRRQSLPMFRMGRMFELLLQMDERAGGLD